MSLVPLPPNYTYACALPTGSNVSANLGGGVSATFTNVSTPGTISVTIAPTVMQQTPANCRLLGSGSYFAVSTTASYTGDVSLTFPYEPTDLTGPASNLRLLHRGSVWTNITTAVDTDEDTVTGRTSSFSDFEIVGSQSATPTPASSDWTLAVALVLGLALAARALNAVAKARKA
jgi:hypothetical protein